MRIAVLWAVTLSACGNAAIPVFAENAGNSPDEIYSGTAPTGPEAKAVVSIHNLTDGGQSVYIDPFCTGTLVAETEDEAVILTAAHCLDVGRTRVKAADPKDIAVYFGDDPAADIAKHLYEVCETMIHPDYDAWANGVADIGFIRLRSSVSEADPVPMMDGSSPLVRAEAVTHMGFGTTENDNGGKKLEATTQVTRVRRKTFTYDQSTGGPCAGDSGGPQFAYRSGGAQLAGVTSYGDVDCLYYGVSMQVSAFRDDILDFAQGGCP